MLSLVLVLLRILICHIIGCILAIAAIVALEVVVLGHALEQI